jgi:sterol desaturase/sphingolipid hydroxylase (fatty acid hydroxylase superfamily)
MKYAIEVSALFLIYFLESRFPLFKGTQERGRHAAVNLTVYFFNLCLLYAVFSGFLVWETHWTSRYSIGLLNLLPGPAWLEWPIAFLLYDLWMYMIHRINHAIPFLWRFHRIHHTDRAVDVTTAFRFHAGEQLISALLFRILIVPLLGLSVAQILLYEICSRPVVLFHHSNLSWPEKYDRLMRWLIVSPNMHRVHHSQAVAETNSNYASFFSFWDRLARTYRLRENPATLQYGLSEFPGSYWQTLTGIMKTPLAPIPGNPPPLDSNK